MNIICKDLLPCHIKRTVSFYLFLFVFTRLFLFPDFKASAQGVGINSSGNLPDPSAILDASSSNQGILIPRIFLLSTSDVITIVSPATALLVYNTNPSITNGSGEGFYYWSGTEWKSFGGGEGPAPCGSAPATPGVVSGSNSVCPNATGQVYSISPVSGATSYNWSVPNGATITSNTGTSVTVSFPAYAGGNINVSATNACGTSAQSTLSISQTAVCSPLNFYYTGASQTFTVPAGVYYLVVKAWGASGGQNGNVGLFGKGGYAQGTVAVSPGDQIQINIGGAGSSSNGGWNGGGSAQSGAGGGGGASDIRLSTDVSLSGRLIVAGGGGGTGNAGGSGGNGGGLNGYASGATLNPGVDAAGGQGGGGTQNSGGTAGVAYVGPWPTYAANGEAGTFGQGGNGVINGPGGYYTGGGGGGWYGGGSGATSGAYAGQCGGGGSGYLDGTVTSGSMQDGLWTGNGQVVISW